jgi:hypothetical protein
VSAKIPARGELVCESPTSAISFPTFYEIPSNFFSDQLWIVQRRACILSAFHLAALHVLPDFFLGLFGLIHYRRADWQLARSLQRFRWWMITGGCAAAIAYEFGPDFGR